MFMGYRPRTMPQKNVPEIIVSMLVLVLITASPSVFGLRSDRDQPMAYAAQYQKVTQSRTGTADDPDITHLDGDVKITQGSMEILADHATIYQNPSGVVDANGDAGGITRIVFTGKPAHLQQVHDGDCRLMTADASTIDYDNVNGVATLTGNVTMVQKGKGEFHGQNMIYNTKTGDMQSGSKSPDSRVHMVIQPKQKTPAAAASGNCGYPGAAKAKNTGKPSSGH